MKTNKLLSAFLSALLLAATTANFAQTLERASPESVGMSSAGLDAITANLQGHIDDGHIAGVVAAVARDGKLVYFQSLGMLDRERGLPMRDDALFRIYSMARQVTSVAVLKLYEEGKFELDDPISLYLPQFADQRVLIDPSSTDLNQTRERVGDITVAQLLIHTSGLGSRSSRLYVENNVRDRNITLDQMVNNAATVPLFHDPGARFNYGIHATILGKLVEVWSGQPFEDYLAQHLFAPLNMKDSMFWAEGADADRLAVVYRPEGGALVPYEIESVPFTQRPRLIEGGVGLLSSTTDFLHFSQMILDGGMFAGNRIFAPETIELMYENAVPDHAMPIGSGGYWLGSGWTLGGFNVVLDPSHYDWPVSEGTIWWDGSAGTRYFIDPQQNMISVIMAQVSPSRGGGFREDFKRLLDDAIQNPY